jgi:cytochrome c biogenesis protein CcmG/thiol:disulfide interchange protein DsbE
VVFFLSFAEYLFSPIMKKLIIPFFLVLFISATSQSGLPNVTLKTLDGKNISIQNYASGNKITVISFWATWCGPCKKELIKLNSTLSDWSSKYNMQLVAISIDDSKTAPKVKPYVAGQNWKCDVLIDQNSDLKRAFGIANVPFTMIIKDGKVVWRHDGYVDGAEKDLEEQLKKLSGK